MLFKKELRNPKPSSVITPSNATPDNIERLGELCEWFSYGGDTIKTLSIFATVFEILTIMTSKRSAYTDFQNLGAKGRSDLQIFKDLEHWIAVKAGIEMWFPREGVAIRYVDNIITHDLDALHPDTAINDHATLLEILELNKDLSSAQSAVVDPIIANTIALLQALESVTLGVCRTLLSIHCSCY